MIDVLLVVVLVVVCLAGTVLTVFQLPGGALLLTVPVPIAGTIVGAAIGCFAGALAAELSLQQKAAAGARVGG